jgi:hypothetical protein
LNEVKNNLRYIYDMTEEQYNTLIALRVVKGKPGYLVFNLQRLISDKVGVAKAKELIELFQAEGYVIRKENEVYGNDPSITISAIGEIKLDFLEMELSAVETSREQIKAVRDVNQRQKFLLWATAILTFIGAIFQCLNYDLARKKLEFGIPTETMPPKKLNSTEDHQENDLRELKIRLDSLLKSLDASRFKIYL